MKEAVYEDSSFIGGLAGALAGAAIGSIPWAVLAYLGWYIGYLSFVIGIASFFGYRYLRGPKDLKVAYVCVGGSSIFAVLFMNIAVIMITLHMEGYYAGIEMLKLIFLLGGAELYKDIAISLFIALLGLSGVKQRIVEYVEGNVLETAAPENTALEEGNIEK